MLKIRRPSVTTVILSVLLLSLLVSGILVVRLIDRLSEKELQERREALESGMLGFRAELAGTLFRATADAHPGPLFFSSTLEDDLAEELVRNSKRGEPSLISGVALGIKSESGEIRFAQFDPAKGKFVTAPWPDEIVSLRTALEPQKTEDKPNPDRRPPSAFLLQGERPMIALPLMYREPGRVMVPPRWEWAERGERPSAGFRRRLDGEGNPADPRRLPETGEAVDPHGHDRRVPPEPGGSSLWAPWGRPIPGFPMDRPSARSGPDGRQNDFEFRPRPDRANARLVGWCLLILDFDRLRNEILPQLLERHFRGREREFGLLLISAPSLQPILKSGVDVAITGNTRVDAALSLIERRRPFGDPPGGRPGRPGQLEIVESLPLKDAVAGQSHGWLLAARHQSGSLESVVQANRRRSIAVVMALLALLGGSGTLLVWSSAKSKELAKRQMEFVAGVSHELLTPLSVIRTAASNLSRGLISDREKALEYGKTLERESKRLSKMIEQVLSFAALQSERERRDCEPVDVSQLLREIVCEYRPGLEQKGWQVNEEIEPVGMARVERRTLESCLYNLIDNATKYAHSGRWLRVTAARDGSDSKPLVRITVEDHGPGIAPEDLRHIFKPFYRGRGLAASSVPGAGLGLSIVRRHLRALGGDASVVSSAQGCVFSLMLPALD